MGEMTIFKDGSKAVAKTGERKLTKLGQTLASQNSVRRIQANTNGTFKRIVGGEQIGKPLRGELNVIIINALPNVSRVYYTKDYDPDAKPTLPDCWSNAGDIPEKQAKNKQNSRCADCEQNIAGSGKGESRACRYQRRVAVLVEGDSTGDIYQINIPARSLFGKGNGNVHSFESYVRYLTANGESPDTVVTNISFNDNADTMELQFSPMRQVTDDEYEQVVAAQAKPEAENYIKLTVAEADGVTKQPNGAKKESSDEEIDEEDDIKEPKKRSKKESKKEEVESKDLADVVSQWSDEDED